MGAKLSLTQVVPDPNADSSEDASWISEQTEGELFTGPFAELRKQKLGLIRGLAFLTDNRLAVSDFETQMVRCIDMDAKIVTDLATPASSPYWPDFKSPHGICVDKDGIPLVATPETGYIYRVDAKLGKLSHMICVSNLVTEACYAFSY